MVVLSSSTLGPTTRRCSSRSFISTNVGRASTLYLSTTSCTQAMQARSISHHPSGPRRRNDPPSIGYPRNSHHRTLNLSTSSRQNTARSFLALAMSLNGFSMTLHGLFQSAQNISTTFQRQEGKTELQRCIPITIIQRLETGYMYVPGRLAIERFLSRQDLSWCNKSCTTLDYWAPQTLHTTAENYRETSSVRCKDWIINSIKNNNRRQDRLHHPNQPLSPIFPPLCSTPRDAITPEWCYPQPNVLPTASPVATARLVIHPCLIRPDFDPDAVILFCSGHSIDDVLCTQANRSIDL